MAETREIDRVLHRWIRAMQTDDRLVGLSESELQEVRGAPFMVLAVTPSIDDMTKSIRDSLPHLAARARVLAQAISRVC